MEHKNNIIKNNLLFSSFFCFFTFSNPWFCSPYFFLFSIGISFTFSRKNYGNQKTKNHDFEDQSSIKKCRRVDEDDQNLGF